MIFHQPKLICVMFIFACAVLFTVSANGQHHEGHSKIDFSIRSVRDGKWSDPKTWEPERVPGKGDRVLIGRGRTVQYDVQSKEVVRLLQIVGTLDFARD